MSKPSSHPQRQIDLIARVWLPGAGCVTLATEGLDRSLVQSILEEVLEASPNSTTANCVLDNVARSHGRCCHLIVKRGNDPNNAMREVANIFVISDSSGSLSQNTLASFANGVQVPATSQQLALLADELETGLATREMVPASDSPSSKSRRVNYLLFSLLAVALLVFFVKGYFSKNSEPPEEAAVLDRIETDVPPSTDWDDESFWYELEKTVRARQVYLAENADRSAVLEAFESLLSIELQELGLTETELRRLRQRMSHSDGHPFLVFINIFLDTPRTSVIGAGVPSASDTRDRFLAVAEHFQSPNEQTLLTGLQLENATPVEILSGLNSRMSYSDFFTQHCEKDARLDCGDPWLKNWESADPANAWLPKIREFLQTHYR